MSDASIITGQVHVIRLSDVKAFLIECVGGSVLVDTGSSEEDADRVIEKLREMGKEPRTIRICILTHHHDKHIGGLKKLKGVCNFEVLAHENDSEKIYEKTGVRVDRKLSGGEVIPFCGGIHVIHVPGHTNGTIVLYLPAFRTLIAGDALTGVKGRLALPPPESCENLKLHAESLRRLKDLDFDIVLVSHGDDVLEQGKLRFLEVIRS